MLQDIYLHIHDSVGLLEQADCAQDQRPDTVDGQVQKFTL